MFGECHAHVIMDAVDFRQAMSLHENGVDERVIRNHFECYRQAGVAFVRDGGDAYGVCVRAKDMAPEYGIDYRIPAFAIHKQGHYGGIVGRGFSTMREYAQLVEDAAELGADFIKIMTTGIMDFNEYGRIMVGEKLEYDEVREMVHIAHEQGFAVMSHTNGAQAVLEAVEAGVDSVEHANYLDAECIRALAQSGCVYVPTACVARNIIGTGKGDDGVLQAIVAQSLQSIAAAYHAGVTMALGSDAGAIGVPHESGVADELACFELAVPDAEALHERLRAGEREIRQRFRRN